MNSTRNDAWGQQRPKGQNRPNFEILNFRLIDMKFEEHLQKSHWIQPMIRFEVNIGQKVNTCQISKIGNFHRIDFKFEEHLQTRSLNSTND